MPQGDRTGPQGQGPKTGKGRGKCSPRAETPHNKVKAQGEPAREQEEVPAVAKAREQAGAPVEVAAKVAEKAAAIGSNQSTIQKINDI